MKSILIVGAGGFGREVFNYAEARIAAGENWRVRGFIDDNPEALGSREYPVGVIGSIAAYVPKKDDVFLCAIGTPKARKAVVETLEARGAAFESLVHPTAVVGRNVRIGRGAVVCPYAVLTCDVDLGDFALINCHATCGHDSKIGAYAVVSSHCDITGYCELGEGAFLASHVSMRPSSRVGEWASVGINSAVVMNVKPHAQAFGTPAVALPPSDKNRA